MVELTKRDQELIMEQCVHQNATTHQEIEGFTYAYIAAKVFAHQYQVKDVDAEFLLVVAHTWASLIDDRNEPGWRTVVAYFKNGKRALDPTLVTSAMRKWAEAFVERKLSADVLFKELEGIHPLFEGNGRLGDLFWKVKRFWETGIWPEKLPPDMFNDEKPYEIPYVSSFGEVE